MTRHPAKFSPSILRHMKEIVHAEPMRPLMVLDPFAGTGRIHQLAAPGEIITIGVEIEPEWAALAQGTLVGNALALPFRARTFDCIATSPTYGNRLADSHTARDGSRRHSYTHDIGRRLHDDNSGTLHFGPKYKQFHEQAWAEVYRVAKPGALFVLNVSDFVRKFEVMPVTEWHVDHLIMTGWSLTRTIKVETPRLKYGANSQARAPHEHILVLRKDSR
jgi:tRNA G10  N-methylase Trm11